MAALAEDHGRAGTRIALARLGIGFAQGVGLWLLSEAYARHLSPHGPPALFAALALTLAYVPLILIGGLGRIRPPTLGAWAIGAALVLAVFAWHDLGAGVWSGAWSPEPRLPAPQVFIFSAIFVFVGHHLVGPADQARRLVAPYPVYFDWAWKDAVQLALSALFVGVLWAALALGSELFKLIGIDALEKLVAQSWFASPVTFVALAGAIQLTDVRVGLILGVRTVGLVLLSWLLPVMTAIVVAFLAALPFTGLAPLFGTRSGASTLLVAAAVLIVLTSAAYQDGQQPVPAVLRWAGRAAGVGLVPLVLIAAYALALRVGQYGLSPARIEAIACCVVAAGFAAGYAFAAVRPRSPWMRPLELTNIVMARVVMLLIVLLFTPIADPARLAVGDQMGRLMSGKTAPDKFDYQFLRYQSGRYGADALARLLALKGSPRNLAIAQGARASDVNAPPAPTPPQTPLSQPIAVYPAGAAVPKSFLDQVAKGPLGGHSTCLGEVQPRCEAYVLDLEGAGSPQVSINDPSSQDASTLPLEVFRQDGCGVWSKSGDVVVHCADAIAALRAGHVALTPSPRRDVVLAGRSFTFSPVKTYGC
jgi:hypothetical protein